MLGVDPFYAASSGLSLQLIEIILQPFFLSVRRRHERAGVMLNRLLWLSHAQIYAPEHLFKLPAIAEVRRQFNRPLVSFCGRRQVF